MGFSLERYQFSRILYPVDTITKQDMTPAATTVLATYFITKSWSNGNEAAAMLLKHGYHAGTANTTATVNATTALFKNGTQVGSTTATVAGSSVLTFPGVTTVVGSVVEQDLNPTKEPNVDVSIAVPTPNYPTANSTDLLQTKVVVQGVTGAQDAFHYLIIKANENNPI